MNSGTVIAYLSDNWAWALGLATFMFGLMSFASLLNQDRRDDVALWLMGEHAGSWNESFITLFDAVFGKDHFSIRCFIRSTIATLIAVVVIWLLMGSADTIGLRMQSELSLGSVLVIGLMINVVADYVSLLETRWLLGRMPRGVLGQIGVLILDLIITALIIWIAIFGYIRSPLHAGEVETFAEILGVFSIFSVFFYSTFLTSVWTWAYIGSTWVMRLAMRLRVSYWLDVEGKPIKVLFLFLAGSVGAVTFAGSLAFGSVFAKQDDGVSLADRTLCTVFKGQVCMNVAELTPAEQAQLDFITLACEGGVTEECLKRAADFLDVDPAKTARLWRAACLGGDYNSCGNLGVMHEKGHGMDVDFAMAAHLYQQACDGGNVSSCTGLGVLHESGLGMDVNFAEAARLFKQGCDGDDMLGCSNLGVMHERGHGMDVNYATAARLYQRGCDGGYARSCTNLGSLQKGGRGMDVDYGAAALLFQRGCDGGDAGGCISLGLSHHLGLGMDVNPAEAARLYQQGCDGGEALGCMGLGVLHEGGVGMDVNLTEAARHYQQSCNMGHLRACDWVDNLPIEQ